MVVSKRFGHVTCYVADVGCDLVHSVVGKNLYPRKKWYRL